MFSKFLCAPLFIGFLALAGVRPAQAQFAVIDIASVTQLIQQYETLQQQLSTAQNQLNQARTEYAAAPRHRGIFRARLVQLVLGGRELLLQGRVLLDQLSDGRDVDDRELCVCRAHANQSEEADKERGANKS